MHCLLRHDGMKEGKREDWILLSDHYVKSAEMAHTHTHIKGSCCKMQDFEKRIIVCGSFSKIR